MYNMKTKNVEMLVGATFKRLQRVAALYNWNKIVKNRGNKDCCIKVLQSGAYNEY